MKDKKLIESDINAFLDQHAQKELLRFVAIGSVDDGKSTFIGRLLYDTDSVYLDQIESISSKKQAEQIDFALITDGLQAEREQGITIDVAYRYFNTEKRKFIIADTPGHEQYTRNMVTGASTADVAVIMIDARYGVLNQSKRHAYIVSLLGIKKLVVCINKMDLVDYKQEVFESIREDFSHFTSKFAFSEVTFVPICAIDGVNVANKGAQTPWYKGPSVLEYLETTPLDRIFAHESFALPIQYVNRPNLNFRGYAGTIISGQVKVGDPIVILPSGQKNTVKEIIVDQEKSSEAFCPQAVTVTLEQEQDISRGDVIVHQDHILTTSHEVEAHLVWMANDQLKNRESYLIFHTTQMVAAHFEVIQKLDIQNLEWQKYEGSLELNDIAKVKIHLKKPLLASDYQNNHQAGAFIVVDRITNATVASGMITSVKTKSGDQKNQLLASDLTKEERAKRFKQKPALIWIDGRPGSGKMTLAKSLERSLFEAGHFAYVLDRKRLADITYPVTQKDTRAIKYAFETAHQMGAIVISALGIYDEELKNQILSEFAIEPHVFITIDASKDYCQKHLQELGLSKELADESIIQPQKTDLSFAGENLNLDQACQKITDLLLKKEVIF